VEVDFARRQLLPSPASPSTNTTSRPAARFAGAFDIDVASCVAPGDDIDATGTVDHVAELVANVLVLAGTFRSCCGLR